MSPTVWLAFGGPWFLPLRATRFSGGSITCILPDQCLHLDTSSGKTSRLISAVSSLLSWAHFVRGPVDYPPPQSVLSLQGKHLLSPGS